MTPLTSKNVMFYRPDPAVERARKVSGWREFHRACGAQGLFFDDIEKAGRSAYRALAFRVERRSGDFFRFHVADGRGAGPIEACQDAFRNAVAGGFPIAEPLDALLEAAPVAPKPQFAPDIAALLGLPPAPTDLLEMIG